MQGNTRTLIELDNFSKTCILSFLSCQNVAFLGQTCTNFRDFLNEIRFWKTCNEKHECSDIFNNFFEFQPNPSPPLAAYKTSRSCVAFGKKMYLYGGSDNERNPPYYFIAVHNGLHILDLETRSWVTCTPHKPRTEHSVVVANNKMWMFGGTKAVSTSDYTNSMVTYNFLTESWEDVDPRGELPTARSGHCAVVLGNEMYIHGGWNINASFNDMYKFNFDRGLWSKVRYSGVVHPAGRCSHGCAIIYVGIKPKLLVFGGWLTGTTRLNDLWEFDFETSLWTEIKASGDVPVPRSRFKMFHHKASVYILGGYDGTSHLCDFYRYSVANQQWKHIPIDPQILKDGIDEYSACIESDILYVFGGHPPEDEAAKRVVHGIHLVPHESKFKVDPSKEEIWRKFQFYTEK